MRLSRRAASGGAVGIAIVVGMAAGAYWMAKPTTHGSLKLGGDSIDFCYQPPEPADWQAQVAHGLVFGVDYLVLSSTTARIHVLSVEMVDPTGGIMLDQASFVPGSGVSIGTAGNKPISTADPVLATLARRVPTDLANTPKPSGVSDPYDSRGWQLAVTMRAPADAVKASMNGFTITYRTGEVTRKLRTPDTVTIGTGKDICKH